LWRELADLTGTLEVEVQTLFGFVGQLVILHHRVVVGRGVMGFRGEPSLGISGASTVNC
jgi:hypothetical protein